MPDGNIMVMPATPTSAALLGGSVAAASPGVYSYDALQSIDHRVVPCIEGLVNEGQIVVIAGSFGIGKTLFSLQMSLTLAIGRDFLGRKLYRPRTVAYLDMEDGGPLMRERAKLQVEKLALSPDEMSLLKTNWHYVDGDAAGDLQWLKLNETGFKTLGDFINLHGVEALVLDNFGRVFPGAESDEQVVRIFFANLAKLRSRCASLQRGMILLPHHVTKPSLDPGKARPSLLRDSYGWLARVRGSGRILDFSQVRLGLDTEDLAGDKYYVLNGVGKSIAIQPLILERDAETLIFEPNQDKDLVISEVFSETPRQRELFGQLPPDRPFRHKDLTELVASDGKKFQKQTISEMLRKGVSNKLLEQLLDGSYQRTIPTQ